MKTLPRSCQKTHEPAHQPDRHAVGHCSRRAGDLYWSSPTAPPSIALPSRRCFAPSPISRAVGEAADTAEAIALCRKLDPDARAHADVSRAPPSRARRRIRQALPGPSGRRDVPSADGVTARAQPAAREPHAGTRRAVSPAAAVPTLQIAAAFGAMGTVAAAPIPALFSTISLVASGGRASYEPGTIAAIAGEKTPGEPIRELSPRLFEVAALLADGHRTRRSRRRSPGISGSR